MADYFRSSYLIGVVLLICYRFVRFVTKTGGGCNLSQNVLPVKEELAFLSTREAEKNKFISLKKQQFASKFT